MPTTYDTGGLPPIGAFVRDPGDEDCDDCSDAARIIEASCQEAGIQGVRFDTECLDTPDGPLVTFELPRVFVTVKRSPYPGQAAQWALEEAGLALLAASRAAAVK